MVDVNTQSVAVTKKPKLKPEQDKDGQTTDRQKSEGKEQQETSLREEILSLDASAAIQKIINGTPESSRHSNIRC